MNPLRASKLGVCGDAALGSRILAGARIVRLRAENRIQRACMQRRVAMAHRYENCEGVGLRFKAAPACAAGEGVDASRIAGVEIRTAEARGMPETAHSKRDRAPPDADTACMTFLQPFAEASGFTKSVVAPVSRRQEAVAPG